MGVKTVSESPEEEEEEEGTLAIRRGGVSWSEVSEEVE